jgi:hypothetical protein
MANDSGILLEQPVLITGADGTAIWQGCGMPGFIVRAIASAAITAGQALVYGAMVLAQWNAATSSVPVKQYIKAHPSLNASAKLWAGVAMRPAASGEVVLIAGLGSIMPVKSLVSGSLTNNLAGAYVIGSATAGAVNVISAAPTTPVSALGRCLAPAGTTGGETDSGSDTIVVVHVDGGYSS